MSFMRYLGIDYGSKRIGVAVSDEAGEFALPFSVLKNDSSLLSEINKIIDVKKIEAIVLGESKDYKGADNVIMISIRIFKKIIEMETGLPVFLELEFLTSAAADRMNDRPKQSRRSGLRMRQPKISNVMLDASAAAIILQSYLNRKL
ncbi:MAG: Holliday junction resolvase RuvX [Candidatus Taylorbacteria bacterium]|nr:Holliday junction resolvase RuvX [Candidatus Taylorbacteria bacterium]